MSFPMQVARFAYITEMSGKRRLWLTLSQLHTMRKLLEQSNGEAQALVMEMVLLDPRFELKAEVHDTFAERSIEDYQKEMLAEHLIGRVEFDPSGAWVKTEYLPTLDASIRERFEAKKTA